MRSRVVSFLYFIAIAAAVVVVVKTVNWLPQVFQTGTLRKYNSIEALKAKLNVKDVYVPAYFPQSISWPPAEILGQTTPALDIFMTFKRAGAGDIALTVRQTVARSESADPLIRLVQVTEKVSYRLKGRNAVLEVGACKDNVECCRISWMEKEYTITVAMKSSPFEVIKIAESMIR